MCRGNRSIVRCQEYLINLKQTRSRNTETPSAAGFHQVRISATHYETCTGCKLSADYNIYFLTRTTLGNIYTILTNSFSKNYPELRRGSTRTRGGKPSVVVTANPIESNLILKGFYLHETIIRKLQSVDRHCA